MVNTIAEHTSRSLMDEDAFRARPWTLDEYETMRQAALAMVRTHLPWDAPTGETRASFDGEAYWALLGALDRVSKR